MDDEPLFEAATHQCYVYLEHLRVKPRCLTPTTPCVINYKTHYAGTPQMGIRIRTSASTQVISFDPLRETFAYWVRIMEVYHEGDWAAFVQKKDFVQDALIA